MATRIKKPQIQVPERSALPSLMERIAMASAKKKRIEADLEKKIAELRAKQQSAIDDAQTEIAEAAAQLEAWAQANPAQWEKKKSLELVHGVIGFRTGAPKVAFDRGIQRKAVEIIRTMGFDLFLRKKEELDKDAIISRRNDAETMGRLATMGIRVVQQETFYIEPKTEEYE